MALYFVSGPQQDAEAQMLLNDIIVIDESNYYMLLSAQEMIDRAKQIPVIVRTAQQQQIIDLEPQVSQLAAKYQLRQASLKQSSFIDDVQTAVRNGWQWLAQKFNSISGYHYIGAAIGIVWTWPIIAAIVTAGGATAYIITNLAETRADAETDQYRISSALDAMLKVPGVEAGDIASLVSSLPTTQGSGSAFDKLIDLAKWGGLFAILAFGYSQFKKAKPAAA